MRRKFETEIKNKKVEKYKVRKFKLLFKNNPILYFLKVLSTMSKILNSNFYLKEFKTQEKL